MNFNNLSSFVMRYDNVGFMNREEELKGEVLARVKELMKESNFFFVPTRKTAIFKLRKKERPHARNKN